MYDIVEVPADASEYSEPLGSKEKFWYGQQYLFKVARAPSGEDWAEKVCAEVARRIGLPHAEYELALWKRSPAGIRGVISRNFCRDGAALVLGNELLAEVEPDYATGVSQFHVSTHTINRVLHTIHTNHSHLPLDWDAPPQILTSAEVFIGYLLLDALVGNTDRHHENWGVLRLPDGIVHLAPTFDHASSLGCHELDSKKARRLNTADHNFTVEAFASKARSALYLNENDAQPLLTSEAFLEAALQLPAAGRFWVEILEQVSDAEIGILVDEVPPSRCSEISAEFAKRIMLANKRALVALKEALQ